MDTWEQEIEIELSKLKIGYAAQEQSGYVLIIDKQVELSTKEQIDEIIDSLKKLREYLL